MKRILLPFLLCFILLVTSFESTAKSDSKEFLILSDTLVFDLSAATYSSSAGAYFIDIPILIHSTNTNINAIDFWFQFNMSKMTYTSTTALVSGLDPFTNFNVNNQVLSNTTSGPSLSFSTPLFTEILLLRFTLNGPCTDILPADFSSIFALINGDLSSYLFIGPSEIPNFQIEQPQPYCSSDSIVFSYPYSDVNGRLISSYAWDFGNGQLSNQQSDAAVYDTEGDFPVTLLLTTVDGCEYTLQNFIPIFPTPVAAFSSSWDEPSNVVSFTNESTISSGSINLYSWDFGTSTSNLQNPSYTFPVPDYYNVTLTATSDLGCTSSITQLVTAIDIIELDSRSFQVYPNPTSTFLQIESNFEAQLRVVDALGKQVTEYLKILPSKTLFFDTSYFAEGLYFLECVEENFIYRERFIVQH